MEYDDIPQEQGEISGKEKSLLNLLPHQYKKGQTGNPSGRPKGQSLKEYARNKFLTMTDDEKEEFFNGISKIELFKMAEGNPQNDLTSNGESLTISVIKYERDNNPI